MRKRYLIVPILTLLLASNVYAITSNEVTYDNEGTTENLTDTLDTLYSELKEYKTGGSVQANQMLEGATGYSKGELVTGIIKSKGEQTYTPTTVDQTIGAGVYLSGDQTIKGDANLVGGNIAAGKSIFGVTGTYTSDANAVAADILSGKTAYVNGSKITGTIGSKGATTYTPGTSNQTIAAGQYLSGTQTIKGDANLVGGNIAKGKSIFGVNGTYTSDATATAANILSGKTAYVNGSKVTGNIKNNSGITIETSTITSDNNYTFLSIPEAAYYDTASKLKIENSELGDCVITVSSMASIYGSDAAWHNYGLTKTYSLTKEVNGYRLTQLTSQDNSSNTGGPYAFSSYRAPTLYANISCK